LIAAFLFSAGCAVKPQDVTHDPSFGNFQAVLGTWKSKVPLRLVQGTNSLVGRDDLGGGVTLFVTDMGYHPSDWKDLGTLPAETEVRIEHLYYWNTFEAPYIAATGSLTAGPYKDRPLELERGLFTKDLMSTVAMGHGDPKVVNKDWTVDGDILEK
jgi:hypothetical protein